jgi:hypothetical protein
LTGCPAPREPFSFYYDLLTGKQVPLALDLDRVAIAPSSLQLDEFLSSIVATEPLLENRISDGPGVLHYVVALVDDVTDEEVWALLDRLNEREDIQWARPYVHRDFLGAGLLPPPYTEGPELILDEITVLFSALTPGSTINALFEEYAVDAEWSEQFPFPFTAYTVLATEETGLTTLELANALHEDPLTIGAYPDFITLYIF